MANKPKILTVDDKPQNLMALEKTLQKLGVEIFKANGGNEALALALEHEFALAIVDVQMPEMDGYELVELLRGSENSANLPVVFVSAIYSDEYHHRKGYESGAVDFMSKPFNPDILLSKVQVFIDLYQKRAELQNMVDELNRANAAISRRTQLLEANTKVGQQITSILDFRKLLAEVISTIQTQFNYPWVGIWLVDADRQNLKLEAATRKIPDAISTLPLTHRGLVAQACRTGAQMLDNKAGQNSNFVATPGQAMVSSELAIPLKFAKETLGVLDIQSERLQAFYPDDMAALELLSTQIAVAIRNARLYAEVERLSFKQTDR